MIDKTTSAYTSSAVTSRLNKFMNQYGDCVELYNNKIVLKECIFKEHFITKLGTGVEAKAKFKVGSKVIQHSIERFKETNPALWKATRGKKTARAKRGNSYCERPPSILIDEDQLKDDIIKGLTKVDLRNKYGVSRYTLDRNMDYYNISTGDMHSILPCYGKLSVNTLDKLLESSDPELAIAIKSFEEFPEESYKQVMQSYLSTLRLLKYIRWKGKSMREQKTIPLQHRFSFSPNMGEAIVSQLLLDEEIVFEQQYRIPNSKFQYDFYIPSLNKLIEIDGSVHDGRFHERTDTKSSIPKNDKEKESLAVKKGYLFSRLSAPNEQTNDLEYILKEVLNA